MDYKNMAQITINIKENMGWKDYTGIKFIKTI